MSRGFDGVGEKEKNRVNKNELFVKNTRGITTNCREGGISWLEIYKIAWHLFKF